jgi:arylsulfatase A-like enzyme
MINLGKSTYYEGGIKGSAFITGGVVPASAQGTLYNGLFGLIDWFPTLIAGASNASLTGTLPLDGSM